MWTFDAANTNCLFPELVEFLKQLFQKHRAETVARSFHASTYLWVALFENRHLTSSIQFVIFWQKTDRALLECPATNLPTNTAPE